MSRDTLNLAALGPAGTFSHALAARLADEVHLLPTIRAVFEHVAAGKGDGLVPLENSEAGGVGPSLDALLTHQVFITAEVCVRVRFHLGAQVAMDKVTVVYAHPQAHEQSSGLVERLGVPVVHTSSNAASAEEAARAGGGAAALTTALAAERCGLSLVARDVQDAPDNTTRFVRISQTPYTGEEATKCSLLLDPRADRAGLLADLLAVFARREINLTRIESRPARRGLGRYVFFIDGEVGPGWAGAVAELQSLVEVKEFGCYPRLEVNGWR
ncbi:ACT domain-containing protein [Methanofollis formosanus]|uniref:ACT domain-containing protein n=1 Tax=Methanofollis formosanus TaxID=299308 RepID=A0A8G1A330_9EURY|nr:prephenate dehydratase domain-containing protein [Methanofollis formosanus]QYZ79533.1 ACT domain-containing protein [Methanofollis formosanus]